MFVVGWGCTARQGCAVVGWGGADLGRDPCYAGGCIAGGMGRARARVMCCGGLGWTCICVKFI